MKHKYRFYIACIAICLSACAPIVSNRGYIFEEGKIDSITRNQTTRAQIDSNFGTPTTTSFGQAGGQDYFYIYSRFVTFSYRAPVETERKVLAVYFDKENRVRDFGFYGLKDKRVITFVSRATATQGKELNFLEQILANFAEFQSE